MMKVVTLLENTSCRGELICEHGLSLYIETAEHKILFDMGQSDAFARNAAVLGIDLSQIDFAVLSHGHYDHGGGLEAFLRINRHAPVYVHEKAFGQYYNGTQKYIGLDQRLLGHERLIPVCQTSQPAPGVILTDCSAEDWRFDPCGLTQKSAAGFLPDSFAHEQYLQLDVEGRRVLFSGCSHRGIGNITRYFAPDVLFGGFHLSKVSDPEQLRQIGRELLAGGGSYYTGHCTGQAQFDLLKQEMGPALEALSTGREVQL